MGGTRARPSDLVELLSELADQRPADLAVVSLDADGAEAQRLTYRQLHDRAVAIALHLRQYAGAGERALLLYPDGRHFLPAFLGCLYAGIIAVALPFPNTLTGLRRPLARLAAVARDCEPTLVATASPGGTEFGAAMLEHGSVVDTAAISDTGTSDTAAISDIGSLPGRPPRFDPDAVALLQYTSGSTSAPRGVRISHANIVSNLGMAVAAVEATDLPDPSTFVVVSWLPHFHDMGLAQMLIALFAGGSSVLMPPVAFLTRPVRWLQACTRYRAYGVASPNFGYDRCVEKVTDAEKQGLDLSGLRFALNGSEPVRTSSMTRFAEAFSEQGFAASAFLPSYGLAEATVYVSGIRRPTDPIGLAVRPSAIDASGRVEVVAEPASARTYVGCGRWPDELRLVIVDPERLTEQPPDQVGEIWIRGASVSSGYWRTANADQDRFSGRLRETAEGPFLRTGDLGFVHNGQLFIIGRRDSLMIVNGRNHHAEDIERAAQASHDAIADGAVVAFLDRDGGDGRVVVVVELRRGLIRKDVAGGGDDFVAEVTAAVQREVFREHQLTVARVVLLRPGGLPRTTSGKVERNTCRQRLHAASLTVW